MTLLETLLDFARVEALQQLQSNNVKIQIHHDKLRSVVASICQPKLLAWLFNHYQTGNQINEDSTANAPVLPAIMTSLLN